MSNLKIFDESLVCGERVINAVRRDFGNPNMVDLNDIGLQRTIGRAALVEAARLIRTMPPADFEAFCEARKAGNVKNF